MNRRCVSMRRRWFDIVRWLVPPATWSVICAFSYPTVIGRRVMTRHRIVPNNPQQLGTQRRSDTEPSCPRVSTHMKREGTDHSAAELARGLLSRSEHQTFPFSRCQVWTLVHARGKVEETDACPVVCCRDGPPFLPSRKTVLANCSFLPPDCTTNAPPLSRHSHFESYSGIMAPLEPLPFNKGFHFPNEVQRLRFEPEGGCRTGSGWSRMKPSAAQTTPRLANLCYLCATCLVFIFSMCKAT